jgi:DNA-binding beta-propeller fold protein YncE
MQGNAPPPMRVIGKRRKLRFAGNDLQNPYGVAVDGAGNVIVSDQNKHCIVIFSAEGGVLRSIGGKGSGAGQLSHPKGVAVDGEGNILVADCGNKRIAVFSAAGEVLRTIGGRAAVRGSSAAATSPAAEKTT